MVGLIGGIASGKSTVSKALGTACGLEVIDADKLGHESYQPGTRCFGKLVDEFGEKIVAGDGTIDRRALGQAVRCRTVLVPARCGNTVAAQDVARLCDRSFVHPTRRTPSTHTIRILLLYVVDRVLNNLPTHIAWTITTTRGRLGLFL